MPRRSKRSDNLASFASLVSAIVLANEKANRRKADAQIPLQFNQNLPKPNMTYSRPPVAILEDMRPRELEELAAWTYQCLGYRNVLHTGAHAHTDGGVDVWMLNPDGLVEVVQCKQLQSKVDATELSYFIKIMRQQHAERGHYWSPSGFTRPAIELAERSNIIWYDSNRLKRVTSMAQEVLNREAALKQQPTDHGVPVVPSLSQQKPILKPVNKKWKGWQITVIVLFAVALLVLLCVFVLLLIFGPSLLASS